MFQWTFPDQAIARNIHGIGKLKPVSLPNQPTMEEHSPMHSSWKQDAHREALSRVRNSKRAEEGMLGKLKTTERAQRYIRPMSRSAVPNGVFHGSPMEYVTSAGLRGGVITTKEGQEWLQKRLKNRIVELDAIDSGDFSAGAPPQINLAPQFDVLNAALESVFNDFASGNFALSNTTSQNIEKVEAEFLKAGSYITERELNTFAIAFQRLTETVSGYTPTVLGAVYAAADIPKIVRNIIGIEKRLETLNFFLKEVARSINFTKPEREQLMNSLRERKLVETLGGPKGTIPAVQPARAPAAPPAAEEEEFGEFEQAPAGQGRRFRLNF
jgi:hypothetical protein